MSTSNVRATTVTPISDGFFKVRFERAPKVVRQGGSRSKLLALTNPGDERFKPIVSVVATTHNFNAEGLKLLGIDAAKLTGETTIDVTNDFTKSLGISVVESTNYTEMCNKLGVSVKLNQQVYGVKRYNENGQIHVFGDTAGNVIYKMTTLIDASMEREIEELVPGTPLYHFDSIESLKEYLNSSDIEHSQDNAIETPLTRAIA